MGYGHAAIAALLALGIASGAMAEGPGVRVLPDSALTPGQAASSDEAEVCSVQRGVTYSKAHRQTPAELKRAVREEYGDFPGDREVDHLIPLCLGGADAKANLWLQPGTGQGVAWDYHRKDKLEAFLCRSACAGEIPLGDAQHLIATDWIAAYRQFFGEPQQ